MARIPIAAASKIAKEYEWPAVIIIGLDPDTGKQHMTTYGVTKLYCRWAAELGNNFKRVLGWPEEACHAKPRTS